MKTRKPAIDRRQPVPTVAGAVTVTVADDLRLASPVSGNRRSFLARGADRVRRLARFVYHLLTESP